MGAKPWVLGISASHNGAACLLHGSDIIVAIQEERLTRRKYDRVFPWKPFLSLNYCLEFAGIQPKQLDLVVVSAQQAVSAPENDITVNPILRTSLNGIPALSVGHHLAHAYSAYARSGFDEAAILVVDGAGSPPEDLTEQDKQVVMGTPVDGWESVSMYRAENSNILPIRKYLSERGRWLVQRERGMPFFGSIGGMYAAVSQQIFGTNAESGKVMGLAPYGTPSLSPQAFYGFESNIYFHNTVPLLFESSERWPNREKEYTNLAASVQAALECILLPLCKDLRSLSGRRNFCYAGGVALNSVANQRIVAETGYDDFYIIPSAEDNGTAIGAAYFGLWQLAPRNRATGHSDALGRIYGAADVSKAISSTPCIEYSVQDDVASEVALRLSEGQIGGFFDGRSEFGPRSLGHRSILCDPRDENMKAVLNERVKHREAFRPFAPSVLEEHAQEWFDFGDSPAVSPFMLRIVPVRPEKRARIPAIVHVDGTARLQTVREGDGLLFNTLRAFYRLTGVPVLLNTSFNVMGEPIVETPKDALNCLLETALDFCAFEDRIVTKSSAFAGVAELFPVREPSLCTIGLNDPTDIEHAARSGRELVVFEVSSSLGTVQTKLPVSYLSVLALCDGSRSGAAIVSHLKNNYRAAQPESIEKALGLLRRSGLIRYTIASNNLSS